ncbi:MAG: hypothetical protein N5P05_004505 (plasmid) [Chroococcopsis gigantea SAG 12.99]|nr:hypothetical protein [Chroococcopsis gigantea SAG 12.99]
MHLADAPSSVPVRLTEPELILLEPHTVVVPQKSIDNYEKFKIGRANPEDSAWVNFAGTCYAVGFLAKNQFHTVHSLNSLKVDAAIPQTLAIVGSAAQRKSLEGKFSLSLGILLPWNEFRDREKFGAGIARALSDFTFRGQRLSVTLESLTALPEGGGIFARGRTPDPLDKELRNPKELNLAVIMLGYRNSTVLVIEKGELTNGATGDFGFAKMISNVQNSTSGQKPEVLIRVICGSRSLPSRKDLEKLARSHRDELREREIVEIGEAIADARAEYVTLLRNWLLQNLPGSISIDEFIISGGTSGYLKKELTEFLKRFNARLNWCDPLEERIHNTFGHTVIDNSLSYRLADVYGLFYKVLNRPLPRLRETKPV